MPRFALARLAAPDLIYVPEPPVFVDLTAGILSQADGDFAGTDSVLSTIAGFVGNEADAGPSFDQDLAGMGFNPGEFQASTFDPINSDYAAFVPGTEGQLVANEGVLGINPAPGGGAPGPTTPPGGVGTTGGPPADRCANRDQLPLPTKCQLVGQVPVSYSISELAMRQGCPDWEDRWSAKQTLGAGQPGEVNGPIVLSAVLMQGDPTIMTPGLLQSNPNTKYWYSVLTFTFHPVKLGHFEFIVRYHLANIATTPQVSVCIDIVA
jgi:hypothetical protein